MTDTKPPSADALAFAGWVLEFLVGYKTWAIEGNRSTVAQRIDAFAEQRAAEAQQAAIEEGLDIIRFAHEWIGGLPVTPSFEDKRAAQATLESAMESLRALADKPAAGKGET